IPSLSASSTVKIVSSKTQQLAFEKNSFELLVAEDVVPETVVGVYVVKSNAKHAIGYYIVAGNIDTVFHMDFISGGLIVQKPLDREKVAKYTLLINGTDFSESISAQSSVQIYISDINDNAPQFRSSFYRFVVSENAIIDSIIGKVEAYDLDIGENSRISYSIDDHSTILHIDQFSGKLYLKQLLDYETAKEYYLNVSAFDSGRPSLLTKALVIILIQDVNDNCPKFTKLAYDATIFDDVPSDAFVTQVFADDIDVIDSGKLRFQILDVSYENHKQNAQTSPYSDNQDYIRALFSIDEKNGAITKKSPSPTLFPVKHIFDPFKISGSKFTLNVTVTDGFYTSSCLVTVTVRHSATSLHKDKDMKKIFEFKIKENIEVGSTLGIVDPNPMSSFEYQLLNGGNRFEIEKYTGNLVVTSKLDADVRDQYQLSVLVKSTIENDK
uniref:Cadherin domain-containing protein n=1 Tax=Romanomermis culicivorax TaxID=13658 RepID=A0A915I058_ROMCU